MIAQRQDANKDLIVEMAQRLGAACFGMDKLAGFDQLVVCPAAVHIVEIKDPAKPWKLTENEKRTRSKVEAAGGAYWIIETPEEMAALVIGQPCGDILGKGNERGQRVVGILGTILDEAKKESINDLPAW